MKKNSTVYFLVYPIAIICIFAIFLSGSASAATVLFTDRADFLDATASLSQEGFNTRFSADNPVDFGNFSVSVTFGNVNWGNGLTFPAVVSEGAGAIYAFDDSQPPNFGNTFRFDFTSPITAFGIDINDFSSPPLTVFNNGSLIFQEIADSPESRLFFGVVDTVPFTAVTIGWNIRGDAVGLDDLLYGTAVPLPATLPLMASGIGLIVFIRRWRNAKKQRVVL